MMLLQLLNIKHHTGTNSECALRNAVPNRTQEQKPEQAELHLTHMLLTHEHLKPPFTHHGNSGLPPFLVQLHSDLRCTWMQWGLQPGTCCHAVEGQRTRLNSTAFTRSMVSVAHRDMKIFATQCFTHQRVRGNLVQC